jgi:glutamyl-tRNA(Gln) amidotransferase subunit E
MANSPHFRLFEEYVEKLQPTVVARVLHTAPAYLRKDGVDIGRLREKHFRMVLDLIADGKMAKEGAEEALKILAENPSASGEEVLKKLGSAEDVDEFIRKLVEERADFVRERGEGAFKPLMGLVMKEFRGKVDGKVVAEKLRKAIEEKISGIS